MDGNPGVRAPSMAELAEQIAGRMRAYAENPEHPDLVGKPEGNPVQIRPAFPDAAAFTERLVQGVQANAQRYAEGVRAPRKHFLDAAKASNAAWKNGVQAAVAGDRFLAGLNKVNPDEAIETAATRSEEHTSELQSPCNLVCRLLLEKKKKRIVVCATDVAYPWRGARC